MFDIQGFNLPSWWDGNYASRNAEVAIVEIARTNANAIAIVPTVYLDSGSSHRFHRTRQSERDENVARAIRRARANGLSVLLKPHVDLLDHGWRGALAPADVGAWFAGYKAVLLNYARLAEAEGADMLSVGVELRSLSGPEYRSYWTDIIDAVRSVYRGQVTYAANWDEVKTVSFWDKVDVIGIDPYLPLAERPDPTPRELVEAWTAVPRDRWRAARQDGKSAVAFYRSVAYTYGKPVLFTELGYRSLDGAAREPGNWQAAGRYDPQEQLDLINAFFTVWSAQGDWFKGVHFWNWEFAHDLPQKALGYTPQGKPAEAAITAWFGGTRMVAAPR